MIRLSRSCVGQKEHEAVGRVLLDSGYLGMGEEVGHFETELSKFLGIPRDWVICVSSGTAALHLAIEAMLQPGDEVLVPSLTFVATFQAIKAAQAKPIACDVLLETGALDLNDASTRITPRTKAIIPVHYASFPGRLQETYDFAKNHGLAVIEDAAHAFGCYYDNRLIGSFGTTTCFSFDGIKNITSGEGGAVICSDPEISERIRDARLLGIHKDSEKRIAGERSWFFDVSAQGYRYHMSNIFAAIGRVQLDRFRSELAPKRVTLSQIYQRRLSEISGIRLMNTGSQEIVPHIQPIRVLGGKRNQLKNFLAGNNVETGIHYYPNHLLSYFKSASDYRLPVTEKLFDELLSLPLHPELAEVQIGEVCDLIEVFFQNDSQVVLHQSSL